MTENQQSAANEQSLTTYGEKKSAQKILLFIDVPLRVLRGEWKNLTLVSE